MQEEWGKKIQEAARHGSLAAVHIDFQRGLYLHNESTFQRARRFSHAIRDLKVPNIWVAYDEDKEALQTSVCAYKGTTERSSLQLWQGMGAHKHEPLIRKFTTSAFPNNSESLLQDLLESMGTTTVLIDGVQAVICVANTLKNGILLNRYNFIAVEDCINTQGNRYVKAVENYYEWIRDHCENDPAFTRRFAMATSDEILEILQKPALSDNCKIPELAL